MAKKISKAKSRIETSEQAKEFIASKMCRLLNDCLNQDIDDSFTCAIILYLTGQILLSNGETDVFDHTINQLVENNQDLFDTHDIDTDDDGTFH